MTRRRRRGLTPEESALWRQVAERTVPLHPPRKVPDPAKSFDPPSRDTAPPADRIEPFRIGEKRSGTAMTSLPPAPEPIRMDRKSHSRMTRGKLKPEARIDLHGMTLDQARGALIRFIEQARARDRRLVLVITGKGRPDRGDDGPIPARRGLLRTQVPQWLRMPPLSAMVLQVSEAHIRHGGEGAFYVYLRRRR